MSKLNNQITSHIKNQLINHIITHNLNNSQINKLINNQIDILINLNNDLNMQVNKWLKVQKLDNKLQFIFYILTRLQDNGNGLYTKPFFFIKLYKLNTTNKR